MREFFKKLIKLYEEVNLHDCSIIVFLHKVDLIEKLLLHHKIKAFTEFIEIEVPIKQMIKIYTTSIAPDFFLETFDCIAKILGELLSIRNITDNDPMLKEFRKGLEIIITYDTNKVTHLDALFYDFNLPHKEALKYDSLL